MRGLLIDLDGVLYRGDQAIEGAGDSVAWLQESGVPYVFVTNTTSRPRRAVRDKLAAIGIDVGEARILTPVIAAARWLKANTSGPCALFMPAATAGDLGDLPRLPADRERGAAAVVVGDLGKGWDYPTLNRAFRLLMDEPQPPLVALGMTRYWRAPDGLRLDVAAFVKALEHAVGCEAVVLGKPSKTFFDAALALAGLAAGEAAMIGDDIVGDVKGAQDAGLRGVLVKTGKFRPADLEGGIAPDEVLDSIAALPSWWQAHGAAQSFT